MNIIKEFTTNSKEETWQLAKEFLANLEDINVILLAGELGAGKTTFTQGLLTAAGAEGPFTSPTFVIMKNYPLEGINADYKTIYHLDCYRVNSQDVLDLGWQEIISNPENLVIVEWPERIAEILPEKYMKISLEIVGEDERRIKMERFN